MHLTRAETKRLVPIARKGTKYVVRQLSHVNSSLSVLVAVRDVLKLAQTAREVDEMIKEKKLKINGRVVRDYREPITLLSLFEADKKYILDILPTGRFSLKETKQSTRFAKVLGKTTLRGNVQQLNLHDGTNILSKDKINTGDSLELDMKTKIVSVARLEKGKNVMIRTGRAIGLRGTIANVKDNTVQVRLGDRTTTLTKEEVIVL